MTSDKPTTVFLLSPAHVGGTRAKQLRSKRAGFPAAVAYRNGGVPIGQAFSFMSALYFRGKIAYAERFANPPAGLELDGALVITPGFGLVRPDWKIDESRMRRLQRTKVDGRSRTYRKALEHDLELIAGSCDDRTRFVLLGSIATGKYVDILHPILGERLLFPSAFVGMGDMQRGSVMLQAARSGRELDYVGLHHPRSTTSTKWAGGLRGSLSHEAPGASD